MGKRLPYRWVGTAPESIEFRRNGRPISARRTRLGEIRVVDRTLRVADPAWVEEVPGLSLRISDGVYPVHAYEWAHQRGAIVACVVIPFMRSRWTTSRRLRIDNDIRPDLTAGLIVDSAEVAIVGGNRLVVPSGLGDGYYPVIENRHLGIWTQSIVIDFELYEVGSYGFGPDFMLDEYGLVVGRE